MWGNPLNRHSQLHVKVEDHQRILHQGTVVQNSTAIHSTNCQWGFLVMIISISCILLWCDPFTDIEEGLLCVSHDFILCLHFLNYTALLPSYHIHLISSSHLTFLAQHPFLSSLCPYRPTSFNSFHENLNEFPQIPFFLPSLLTLSYFICNKYSAFLHLCCNLLLLQQEPEPVQHLTRVEASRPDPKKWHPTGDKRGDEGLVDNPRYVQELPVKKSHILYWYPR